MNGLERDTRDDAIVEEYIAGFTLREIGEHYHVSHECIRQVLKRKNVKKEDRKTKKTDRTAFLGVNVRANVKEKLEEEASKLGISVSELTDRKLGAA